MSKRFDGSKAVAVAKDVLKQLKAAKYRAKRGVYVKARVEVPVDKDTCDLRDLKLKTKRCEVCAIGSAFMSYAKLYDNVPVDLSEAAWDNNRIIEIENGLLWVSDDESLVQMLEDKKVFRPGDLRDMEGYFESYSRGRGLFIATIRGKQVSGHYTKANAATAALTVIMKNIIRNNGKFILAQERTIYAT